MGATTTKTPATEATQQATELRKWAPYVEVVENWNNVASSNRIIISL